MSTAEKDISSWQIRLPDLSGKAQQFLENRRISRHKGKIWGEEVSLRLFSLQKLEPIFHQLRGQLVESEAAVGTQVYTDQKAGTVYAVTRMTWDYQDEEEATFKRLTMVRDNKEPNLLSIYHGEDTTALEITLTVADWDKQVMKTVHDLLHNPDICAVRKYQVGPEA